MKRKSIKKNLRGRRIFLYRKLAVITPVEPLKRRPLLISLLKLKV